MLFNKDDLVDEVHETVYNKICGKGRWSIRYERVFKHEGKFYMTHYQHGATENQDESAYEYDGNEIECEEVEPYEVTVIKYRKVK